MELLFRETEPLLREAEPALYEPELRVVEEPPRATVEPVRDAVPVLRTEDDPERVPGVERETLVSPVEVRRTRVLPLVEVPPPARVMPLLRPEAPPRETKLRRLPDASWRPV